MTKDKVGYLDITVPWC